MQQREAKSAIDRALHLRLEQLQEDTDVDATGVLVAVTVIVNEQLPAFAAGGEAGRRACARHGALHGKRRDLEALDRPAVAPGGRLA